jgi:Protein of unknown function (DUF1367)
MTMTVIMRQSAGGLVPADQIQANVLRELDLRGIVEVTVTQERVSAAHRRLFALFGYLFDLWEPGQDRTDDGVPIKLSRTAFRHHLTISAGHYTQVFRADGTFTVEARSLSYAEMGQVEFDQLYSAVIDTAIRNITALRGVSHAAVDAEIRKFVR